MADKPTVDPKWATNQLSTEVIEPVQSFKDSGIAAGSTVARRNFNWMFNAISQWIDWIRSYAMDRTLNLSDLDNKATSRANLGADNAANLTNGIIPSARLPDSSLTATGAVTGTVTLPKSGNASIALSASPTLTLSGDVTGSATFNNLANATLTATVQDNSHAHDASTLTSASTTVKGVVQLSTSTSSTSTTLAATSSAVKSAYDRAADNTAHVHSSTQIGTATAQLTAGAVGTYAMLWDSVARTTEFGVTRTGSELRYANTGDADNGAYGASNAAPSGVWRCCGYSGVANSGVVQTSAVFRTTLWVRIS